MITERHPNRVIYICFFVDFYTKKSTVLEGFRFHLSFLFLFLFLFYLLRPLTPHNLNMETWIANDRPKSTHPFQKEKKHNPLEMHKVVLQHQQQRPRTKTQITTPQQNNKQTQAPTLPKEENETKL